MKNKEKIKKQSIVDEFKQFIMRGNVIDLAVGVIVGGGIETAINKIKEANTPSNQFTEKLIDNAVTNIINTKAGASYSIRSSSKEYEEQV